VQFDFGLYGGEEVKQLCLNSSPLKNLTTWPWPKTWRLILDENGIEYLLEESALLFNPTFATQTAASREYSIKISSDDFEKATAALTAYESSFTDDVEADYYLFSFQHGRVNGDHEQTRRMERV